METVGEETSADASRSQGGGRVTSTQRWRATTRLARTRAIWRARTHERSRTVGPSRATVSGNGVYCPSPFTTRAEVTRNHQADSVADRAHTCYGCASSSA